MASTGDSAPLYICSLLAVSVLNLLANYLVLFPAQIIAGQLPRKASSTTDGGTSSLIRASKPIGKVLEFGPLGHWNLTAPFEGVKR